MNKQIIDVTQCPYYKEDKTCTYLPFESKCEGDCNWTAYKEMEEQLKAKEQECEELRGVIRKDICSHYVLGECSQKHHNNCVGRNQCIKDLEQQLDQLKAENETLKQYKASKQASYESIQREWNQAVNENRELKAEIETLKSFDINLVGIKECEIRQLVQYRKTIAEIKEYLRPYLVIGGVEPQWVEWQMAQREKERMAKDILKILQKISEVINE